MAFEISGNDKNVEILKMKKLIKLLDSVRGHGTSLISLTINPQDQTSRVAKMLAEEHQTASNIKKRVTRQSVLDAITSAQSRLKLYKTVPRNGIVLYTGMGITEDGKKEKFAFDLSDDKFGFIVIDGNGTLIGTLSGDSREVVHKFKVELPKKHEEEVNQLCWERGFNQVIELSSEILSNVNVVKEQRLIGKLFQEINQDTGKYVFGIDDTIKALEMGVIEILLVGKDLGALAGDPGCFPLDDEEDKMALVEWLSYHYTEFGCSMEFVTNKSEEGSQFCSVFDGIGGILRYEVDIRAFDEDSDDDDDGVAAEWCGGDTSSILKKNNKNKSKAANKSSVIVDYDDNDNLFKESVVLSMESENPYLDFKKSMEEMVEINGLKDWKCWRNCWVGI
ncbi:hypothetical protein LWI28_009055 [Acer negundo]|uniref:eRF1/Pelota-like N-terminal domain-containing protein n=1 Tax=Acer negundo TaxID=4023 RepID=A0AAD5NFE8_ACENE|nr:hypothetical protein LWI28_009055 [Acer negundo]